MTPLNKQALRGKIKNKREFFDTQAVIDVDVLEALLDELEARTVVVKQFDDFQIVHYGGSEDYAKGYIDCQNNYKKALTAAGIGVKGE
ncbi:hypothetical protein LZ96_00050 [Salmonella enterica]|nr:hypothetical protein [Salmonella enterica]